jgi:DNA polymerase-4
LHAVRDRAELGAVFTRLCEQVAADLQRKGYMGRTIGVKLRFTDFRIATRDHTITGYTDQAAAIRHAAGQALKRAPLAQRLRLLGVRVGGLLPAAQAAVIGSSPAGASTNEEETGDAAQQALLF